MNRNVDEIKKIVYKFLEQEHIHGNYKLLKIKDETVSTYDGTYPSIELIYESSTNNLLLKQLRSEIINNIEKYTGLNHNSDFWLGISYL